MEFKRFTTLVRDEVERRAGGNCMVRLSDVRKNNGIVLSGLTVMKDDSNISPTIYLNNYYEAYENGHVTIISVVNDVIDTYHKNRFRGNVDMKQFMDYNNVKDKIVYKLVNTEKNKALLAEVPHIDFLDLSIVFQFLVAKQEESTASILIHNAHANLWKVTADELYNIASENTQRLLGYSITNMNDIMREIINSGDIDKYLEGDDIGDITGKSCMYVLTNNNRIEGAACIIYPDLLNDLAYSMGCGFYVIPSSIHEVLIVPAENPYGAEEIRDMIREVNDTQVEIEEILSYSLYYFDKNKCELLKV